MTGESSGDSWFRFAACSLITILPWKAPDAHDHPPAVAASASAARRHRAGALWEVVRFLSWCGRARGIQDHDEARGPSGGPGRLSPQHARYRAALGADHAKHVSVG